MDIIERGKKYAEGKALSALSSVIEQAYIDGYNDGLKHLENEKIEAIKDGVEYVDLGLKGALWSSKYVNPNMTYLEASKLNLPTKEQFEDLCRESFTRKLQTGFKFIGINGESIIIDFYPNDPFDQLDQRSKFNFWLKDDEESNEKLTANVKIENNKATPVFEKVFMGLKLPIMLVKNK